MANPRYDAFIKDVTKDGAGIPGSIKFSGACLLIINHDGDVPLVAAHYREVVIPQQAVQFPSKYRIDVLNIGEDKADPKRVEKMHSIISTIKHKGGEGTFGLIPVGLGGLSTYDQALSLAAARLCYVNENISDAIERQLTYIGYGGTWGDYTAVFAARHDNGDVIKLHDTNTIASLVPIELLYARAANNHIMPLESQQLHNVSSHDIIFPCGEHMRVNDVVIAPGVRVYWPTMKVLMRLNPVLCSTIQIPKYSEPSLDCFKNHGCLDY